MFTLTFSSLRRRWPEMATAIALLILAALAGGVLRAAALLLLAGIGLFAIRRRAGDVLRAAAILATILVVVLLSTLVVDLGPFVREWAEQQASRQIDRPLHIGRLGIHLRSGQFVLDNVRIDGKKPGDKPFLTARRISVGLPWWELVRHRRLVFTSIDMTDWDLLVEKRGGWHSFIRIPKGRQRKPDEKPAFTTTLDHVHAGRGRFTYVDHGSWTTTADHLDIVVDHSDGRYMGRGSATAGRVQIKTYLPMRTDIRFAFEIKGSLVEFSRIDFHTDNSHSRLTGVVDVGRWPEQTYQIESRVDLWRSREVFFEAEKWRIRGTSDFKGTYRLFKDSSYELKGTFASDLAYVNTLAFPDLRGEVVWRPDDLHVPWATARFYGGTSRFAYSLAPLSGRTPTRARFDASYRGVDLGRFSDVIGLQGLRMEGSATGRSHLEWPLGRWAQLAGDGEMTLEPPSGVTLLTRTPLASETAIHDEPRMYGPEPYLAGARRRTPMGGRIAYRLDPEWVIFSPSVLATERTYVEFEGQTAYGQRSRFPFYARSADWQESDRVMASIITAVGSPTRVVPLGGHGEFRGVMLGAMSAPRVEGRFAGERMRAWDVEWGRARADLVVENSYVDITGGRVTLDDSEILVDGRFALGYPRRDGGEEINARIVVKNRELRDFRHAFILDDYPIEGKTFGEYRLYGKYSGPYGYGHMSIVDGVAYDEPFDVANSPLRFEGTGVRLEPADMRKSTGVITAAAHVLWEGRYTFNATGRAIPAESVAMFKYESAPLSGVLNFKASGTGTFLNPRYEASGSIDDLFVKDEGIGQVNGQLNMRDDLLTIHVEAASPRLSVSGHGLVEMNDTMDAELTFRVEDTSLDPYLRVFEPRLSPFTRAVASGTIRAVGQLYNPERLFVEAKVDKLDLRLFDYRVRNEGSMRLAFDRNTVWIDPRAPFRLQGEDTSLEVTGLLDDQGRVMDLGRDRIGVKATGDTNLAVLQGFFRDIRSSGRAGLSGTIQGSIANPVFSGSATISNGRIRYGGFPSVQAINGRVGFGASGITMDDVTAQIANGRVRFGGGIGMTGYTPGQLSLTATGENLNLRYPEGMRSIVDADLTLVGTFAAPTLTGIVNVKSAVWRKRIDISPGLIELASGLSLGSEASAQAGSLPLRFDVQVLAPNALRMENNLAQIVASGDLRLRGDYAHPVVLGSAEIERGQLLLEGKRYVVTQGRIDFANPNRIEPLIDFGAQTRVRAPGQTYVVDLRLSGSMKRFEYQLSSDPPLPPVEILTLLFGGETSRGGAQDAELRTLQRNQVQGSLGYSRLEQALVGTLSGNVTRAVEQVFGLDTVQLTPSLFDPYQRIDPTARLTVGKRVSNKVYLTFSRSLTHAADQLLLLEFDQSDRLSWVFSRNEDNTYALDVRVRHVF